MGALLQAPLATASVSHRQGILFLQTAGPSWDLHRRAIVSCAYRWRQTMAEDNTGDGRNTAAGEFPRALPGSRRREPLGRELDNAQHAPASGSFPRNSQSSLLDYGS